MEIALEGPRDEPSCWETGCKLEVVDKHGTKLVVCHVCQTDYGELAPADWPESIERGRE